MDGIKLNEAKEIVHQELSRQLNTNGAISSATLELNLNEEEINELKKEFI